MQVGESPIWDARTSTLYFVNIQHREVHIYRPAGGLHKQIKVPGCVGNIALTRHQDFLLASLQRCRPSSALLPQILSCCRK